MMPGRAWWVLVVIVPLMLLAWFGVQPGNAERWPIRWLEVEGRLERVTSAQVRAAVADQARFGFFSVDMDVVRRKVEELPWVAQADVSRQWPDALVIRVEQHRAVARWNGDFLLSDSGRRFKVAGTGGMQGLARLSGPEARGDEVFETWRGLTARLNRHGLEVAALDLDPRGAWSLHLADGRILLLGREQLVERVDRFLSVRQELAEIGNLLRIDLRYPNGLAVMPAAVSEQAEAQTRERLAESTDWAEQALDQARDRARNPARQRDHHG